MSKEIILKELTEGFNGWITKNFSKLNEPILYLADIYGYDGGLYDSKKSIESLRAKFRQDISANIYELYLECLVLSEGRERSGEECNMFYDVKLPMLNYYFNQKTEMIEILFRESAYLTLATKIGSIDEELEKEFQLQIHKVFLILQVNRFKLQETKCLKL